MQATIVFEKIWSAINAKNEDGSRKYRYIINTGSSRSSKTYSILQSHHLTAYSQNNKRVSIWRETKQDVKNTVLADLKKAFNTFPYNDSVVFNITESIYKYSNGSTIEICGGDDTNRVHGFQGDVAHFNEPYKMPKEVFDQIDMRTSDYIIIDWNPKANHWIDQLSKQDNAIVIHSTFKDNPFVPEQQRLKILSYEPTEYNISQGTANEWMWKVYGLGLKAEKPNLIFNNWKKCTSEFYNKLEKKEYFACDWGKSDPWAIVGMKVYDGSLYFKEYNYLSENKWREQMDKSDNQKLGVDIEGLGIVQWLFNRIDIPKNASIDCDHNKLEKIAMLRRCGYEQAKIAIKGKILEGIDILHNLQVYYTDDSENMEYELENYEWELDRYGILLEEPVDKDNHLMDCCRYLAKRARAEGLITVL